jgi:Fur family iron response transcriptional regulator
VIKVDQSQSELRRANLLPTRQRIALASLLFGGDDRHVTAEALYEQAISMKMLVSLCNRL